jgi:hypothetical protein
LTLLPKNRTISFCAAHAAVARSWSGIWKKPKPEENQSLKKNEEGRLATRKKIAMTALGLTVSAGCWYRQQESIFDVRSEPIELRMIKKAAPPARLG